MKLKSNKDSNTDYIDYLGGIFFVALFVFVFFKNYLDSKENHLDIENNKVETIGKVSKITTRKSFYKVEYYFYWGNTKFESETSIRENDKEYLNRFFKVNFSARNPINSEILLDREIVDTNLIAQFPENKEFKWRFPSQESQESYENLNQKN